MQTAHANQYRSWQVSKRSTPMLHARPFIGGVPLYRQVQSRIEDMIRANPRARAIPCPTRSSPSASG
jgi:hypothetical protein